MTDIESFKKAILLEFRERRKDKGEAIPMSEWNEKILPNYTANEQELFMKAIKELQNEGRVECRFGEGIILR